MENEIWKAMMDHSLVIIGSVLVLGWVVGKVRALHLAATEFVAHILDERLPKAIHETLNNGIKDVMRSVVDDAIRDHEKREEENIKRMIDARRRK